MNQSIYCNPKIYIDDVAITQEISGSVNVPGNNQLTSLKFKINGIGIEEASIMNKPVRFYLNYGSEDTSPFFMGFIKKTKVSENQIDIEAFDSRCLIAGEYAQRISLDEDFNYDGYSVGAFIKSYIDKYVNTKDILIATDKLRDTDPPVPMLEERFNNVTPYQIMLNSIKKAVDDKKLDEIYSYEIGMNYNSGSPSITFIKQKPLSGKGVPFSYGNGISKLTYTKKQIPNRGKIGNVFVDFGGINDNHHRITKEINNKLIEKNLEGTIPSPAMVRKEGYKALLRYRKETYDVSLQATKGHYLQLGQLIYLNVDSELKGNHRITSKSLNFGSGGATVNFKLNTKPLTLNNSY